VFEHLESFDGSPAAERQLTEGLERHLHAVLASEGRGDRSQVVRAEEEVRADPKHCILLDSIGEATVRTRGRTYLGGRFETPTLGELMRRARALHHGGPPLARLRLWLLHGVSPITDIGAMQAFAPHGALFQVASQFNCLEAPEPRVVPVADYFRDPTQGPRASISAFPGTLVRHYAAPASSGGRFVQASDHHQVNLLADVCRPGVAAVHNGYLTPSEITDPQTLAQFLEKHLDVVRIGVHDRVEVVLGYDWDGQVPGAHTIAQVFTSTLAAGLYGHIPVGDPAFATIIRQLLRAAYLGTLLAATALNKKLVVLTLVGGGAFGNPVGAIFEAIEWAIAELSQALPHDLTVVVNARNVGDSFAAGRFRTASRASGGGCIHFDHAGAALLHSP
jgi:hypothetical protein